MTDNNKNMETNKSELLNIFIKEEDKNGSDILAMSDFFDVFVDKIESKMNADKAWKRLYDIEGFVGEIAAAIKGGFDISQKGMFIADDSHYSLDIVEGLKTGKYHVAQSKEVSGNCRPAIVDENERLVKFFTLKKAFNVSSVLSDIMTLSMQASLRKISFQLEDIHRDIKEVIDSDRNNKLNNPFIHAREEIMSAISESECETHLEAADCWLKYGHVNLYSDINRQIENLAREKGLRASVKRIDTILSYISEDMQMIPRYVGLRAYLLNYRGKTENVKNVLNNYHDWLQRLTEKKRVDGKYTALEWIHMNYPYNENNVDFWIEKPKQMLKATNICKTMLEQEGKDIFYIDGGLANE